MKVGEQVLIIATLLLVELHALWLHTLYRSPHHQFELSEYTPMAVQGVSVTSNPAYDQYYDGDSVKYELPPAADEPFSVSNPVYQNHEPSASSDMLKGDHEYDYIPAMLASGRHQQLLGESTCDNDPFAKASDMPQISHPSTDSF